MPKIPFYSETHQDFIVAEMCECGHLQKDHGSLNIRLHDTDGRIVRLPNDGGCCNGHCGCDHYRWARWVTSDEYASMIVAQRRHKAVS